MTGTAGALAAEAGRRPACPSDSTLVAMTANAARSRRGRLAGPFSTRPVSGRHSVWTRADRTGAQAAGFAFKGKPARHLGHKALGQHLAKAAQREPLLGHLVAGPNGRGLVIDGVEVDGDREWGSDLILPAISLADRLRVVKFGSEERAELVLDLQGDRGQRLLPREGQHRH